ncbi:MAG: hypothetical protein HY898_10640 [Deltaproteobacteria bacterium]|nr:hypothetical protein [Deltaproteobacteria bacterium]
MAEFTVDDARAVLESHVRTTRWLRRGIAAKLPIDSFAGSGAFHVIFQSFTEERRTYPSHVPFHGQIIDGPENGAPPRAWDILVQVPGTFINQNVTLEVPHTASVKTCHGCDGSGQNTCGTCGGRGQNTCGRCNGRGHTHESRTITKTDSQGNTTTTTEHYDERCWTCSGSGHVTCGPCGGTGRITCSTCSGHGKLKHFTELLVEWKTHSSERVLEKSDLPDDLVAGAQGSVVHEEEDAVVEQRAGGGGGPYRGDVRVNSEVHDAANKLIAGHRFGTGVKLHRQKLVVRGVPVFEAHYRWGKAQRRFWVFGLDRQVHAPNYPLSIVRIASACTAVAAFIGGITAFAISASRAPPAPPPSAYSHPAPLPIVELPPAASANPVPTRVPMVAASGPVPKPAKGRAVVELRTDPPGAVVQVDGKRAGVSPLFLAIAAPDGGECTGGRCNGGACTPGSCSSGMCLPEICSSPTGKCDKPTKCANATCTGSTCEGARCEGASCPKGYRCSGARCSGKPCTGGTCDGTTCRGYVCSGSMCSGGTCSGGCAGSVCPGGACTGGTCEKVTIVVLKREGKPDQKLEIGPSDAPLLEVGEK